jgi:hypothetical protein
LTVTVCAYHSLVQWSARSVHDIFTHCAVPLFTDIQSQQTINSVMAAKVIRFAEYSAPIKWEIALSTVITGQSKQNPSYQLRRYCSRTARHTSHSRACSDNDGLKKN